PTSVIFGPLGKGSTSHVNSCGRRSVSGGVVPPIYPGPVGGPCWRAPEGPCPPSEHGPPAQPAQPVQTVQFLAGITRRHSRWKRSSECSPLGITVRLRPE